MKVFTLPPQPDITLEDIKAASATFARKHGYVEEGSRGDLKGFIGVATKVQNLSVSSCAKVVSHKKSKATA